MRCVSALGIPGQTPTCEATSAGLSSRRDLGNQVRFCQGESSGSGGSREPGAFGRSQTLDITSRINDCPPPHLRPSSLHFLILKRRRWGWGSCRGRLARTSVVSDSVTPWTVARQASLSMGFPGKNTGVGCHALLQGIFPTQG